ncbi:DNA repair protein RecO [Burkholderiales bacterium]|nr:DNA repair protein RecO [Burkholderiales bacterium]
MARRDVDRHDERAAFVLHAWPYKETSLIVEAFAEIDGRVAMVARGAKRPRSELHGVLQAFQPVSLSWSGAGELKTLIRAEWRGGMPLPGGSALLCGFYLNELVLKLLPREDPHPRLYAAYRDALAGLAGGAAQAPVLRRFEVALLAELGYAMQLSVDADTGAPLDPDARYHYAFDRGARRRAPSPGVRWPEVRGATLIALASGRFDDASTAAEAKRLMRDVIDHHLESRTIQSRKVVRDLQTLEEDSIE